MLKFIGPTTAGLRHAGTAVASIIAVLSLLAGLDPDTSAQLLAATKQALGGLVDVLTALGTIATIAMAMWARWSAKPDQQVAAVRALPNAQVVAVDPSQPLTAPAPAKVSSSPLALLIGLACILSLLGGCAQVKDQLSTPAGQAAALGTTYRLTKVAFDAYAGSSIADPAVVAAVTKARTIADALIAKAQADILAAQNQTALQIAVMAGLDALGIFEQAMVTYGVTASLPATAPTTVPPG